MFKTIINAPKTLLNRFSNYLATVYTKQYKKRLKQGYETSQKEDELYAYCVLTLNK